MNKNGSIIIVEDDKDDQELLTAIFKKLGYMNDVVYFFDGNEALKYLSRPEVQPFLVLSDINMPKLNGFELRSKIFSDEELKMKCIPFLFFSTVANKKSVTDAYAMSVQGFFVKKNSVKELEHTIKVIIEYWQECIAPNEYQ